MSTSIPDRPVVSDNGATRRRRPRAAVSIAVVIIEQRRIRDREDALQVTATQLAQARSDAVVARADVIADVFH